MKREFHHDKMCMIHDQKTLRRMKSEPTVSCSNCGAQSNDAENLCAPVSMSGSGFRK